MVKYQVHGYTIQTYEIEPDENGFTFGIIKRIKILLSAENSYYVLSLIEKRYTDDVMTSTWGLVDNLTCEYIIPNHRIIKDTSIDLPSNVLYLNRYNCDIFEWTSFGDDSWHPSGYIFINGNYFSEALGYYQ